jgi:hypothetical protein
VQHTHGAKLSGLSRLSLHNRYASRNDARQKDLLYEMIVIGKVVDYIELYHSGAYAVPEIVGECQLMVVAGWSDTWAMMNSLRISIEPSREAARQNGSMPSPVASEQVACGGRFLLCICLPRHR